MRALRCAFECRVCSTGKKKGERDRNRTAAGNKKKQQLLRIKAVNEVKERKREGSTTHFTLTLTH